MPKIAFCQGNAMPDAFITQKLTPWFFKLPVELITKKADRVKVFEYTRIPIWSAIAAKAHTVSRPPNSIDSASLAHPMRRDRRRVFNTFPRGSGAGVEAGKFFGTPFSTVFECYGNDFNIVLKALLLVESLYFL
jgi:hypothetical protein